MCAVCIYVFEKIAVQNSAGGNIRPAATNHSGIISEPVMAVSDRESVQDAVADVKTPVGISRPAAIRDGPSGFSVGFFIGRDRIPA